LQHADELPCADRGAEPAFEGLTQFGEGGRQLPIAVDRGVIQGSRLALQNGQIMQRIKDFFAFAVAAAVPRDYLCPAPAR
jgi:hypothetical protein